MNYTPLMCNDDEWNFVHYYTLCYVDNTGWNAAATVFGPLLIDTILCHWHVHRLEII